MKDTATKERDMTKARATFPEAYPEGCLGHDDTTCRNGHYFHGQNQEDILRQISEVSAKKNMIMDVQEWPSGKFLMRIVPTAKVMQRNAT
jgi:hypothetical protein